MQKFLFLTLLFALSILTTSSAQNAEYRHTFSATAGLNVFQIIGLIDNVGDDATTQNLNTRGTASYGLTYDYGVKKWFSIGLGASFNNFKLSADRIDIDKEDGSTYTGPVDLKLNRINLAIRPLFHYANNGRLDLYSGFRLGVNVWNVDLTANEDLLPGDVFGRAKETGATLGFQLIPFGLRGYVTKNLAIGFETGLGGPHYAAAQVSYRL